MNKRKLGKSNLYSGNTVKDTLFGPQWVYVLSASDDCHYDWKAGQKVLLDDGLVLYETDLKLYDKVIDNPLFAALHEDVKQFDADVVTKAVTEGAILAADTEEEIQLKIKGNENTCSGLLT